MEKFTNRYQAGKILAKSLHSFLHNSDVIVLALPRGGVPVAYEVAQFLNVPLDVFIVRKLGVPGHEEFAMGAVGMDGTLLLNQATVKALKLSSSAVEEVLQKEKKELIERQRKYRDDRPFPSIKGKNIILVDDGIATGSTMRVAIDALRKQKPASITVAVPVSSLSACEDMKRVADHVICVLTPPDFYAVGQWYEDFAQTTDEEVYRLLAKP